LGQLGSVSRIIPRPYADSPERRVEMWVDRGCLMTNTFDAHISIIIMENKSNTDSNQRKEGK